MLTFINEHLTQSTAEAGMKVSSFVVIWPSTEVLDKH